MDIRQMRRIEHGKPGLVVHFLYRVKHFLFGGRTCHRRRFIEQKDLWLLCKLSCYDHSLFFASAQCIIDMTCFILHTHHFQVFHRLIKHVIIVRQIR